MSKHQTEHETPAWYDESKLCKAYFAPGYSGWVVEIGGGLCRYANEPLLGKSGPQYGDLAMLIKWADGQNWVIPITWAQDAVSNVIDIAMGRKIQEPKWYEEEEDNDT